MMNGGVHELACLNRLRSRDMKGKIKEEEKGKMHYCVDGDDKEDEDDDGDEDEDEDEDEDGDDDEDEEEKMRHSFKKVKDSNASTANLKNEKRSTMHPLLKNKSVSSNGRAKEMRNGDHDKDKRWNTPLPLDKNKDYLKEKSRKIPSTYSAEKKIHSCDLHKDKRASMHIKSKRSEKEKRKNISSHNGERKICSHDKGEHNGWKEPHRYSNSDMHKNKMKKKNTPLDLSKENKTQMMMDSKKENKRRKTPEIFNTSKKMRTEDRDDNAGNDDRCKTKKKTKEGYNKEQKVPSCHKKTNVTIAFFKLIFNNFEKFLLLPPVVASRLIDLTNCRVNLQDSEGKVSKVRLSIVDDGSLAFDQGWDNFVSDHLIKLGDFLLFEYTAKAQFSVRVFGMDSCERVCFSVGRQGGMEQKRCHAPDKTENVAVSGARCVAVNSKEDRNRVVSGFKHGSLIAVDDKDEYLANAKHKANDIFQTRSKGTRNTEIILITDDEAPLTQENEDTEKLKTLHTASETHTASANTKEDPKGAASGAFCGPSVAPDNKEETFAIGECKTNCISEIIPVIDAAPLEQGNDVAAELTAFPLHIENISMMKESEPVIAAPAKCTDIHDSDEDLRRKQEGNTGQSECTASVDKRPNNSKMNTNGDVCSKHEAPGGSPSLEKWKKATMSGQAALAGTGLIKPEKVLKTEDKLVGNFSSMGVNSIEQSLQVCASRAALDRTGLIRPEKRLKTDDKLVGNCSTTGVNLVEQPLQGYAHTRSCVQQTLGNISKSIHIKTEIEFFANCKGPTVQPKTQMEQFVSMGSIASRQQMNNISVRADHAVSRPSEHQFFSQEGRKASHHVTPAGLLPVNDEILELDDHSVLNTNLQFCIPSTTQTWLNLPSSVSNALRRKGRQDRSVVMLKDPMKRLWPVFYHENSLFVGFTRGWKPFVAANNLQTGDACMLLKDINEDELVYHVQFTRK